TAGQHDPSALQEPPRDEERARSAALERDAHHEAPTSYVHDTGSGEPRAKPRDPPLARATRAFDQGARMDRIERCERGSARDRRAEVGRRVERRSTMSPPRGHRGRAANARADGQACSEALAETQEVRHDAGIDAREPRAAPAEPRPDLVAHEERPSAVADVAKG